MSQVWVWPDLVSGRDQFCTCQMVVRERLVYIGIAGSEMGGERGDYSSEPHGTRGGGL
jgi:hypothetical protein